MMYASDEEIIEILQRSASADFLKDAERFLSICTNDSGFPLGAKHIEYLDRLFDSPIGNREFESVLLAYIYFASACFAMDRVADRQSVDFIDTLAVPELVSKGIKHLCASDSENSSFYVDSVSVMFADFRNSMELEAASRRVIGIQRDRDEAYQLGQRSVLFVSAYSWLCFRRGISPDPIDVGVLQRFVMFMQRGDDLGDWREDFLNENLTFFLRNCLKNMDSFSPSPEELEEFIYLSGIYEEEGRRLILGFEGVIRDLEVRPNSVSLIAFVRKQLDRVLDVVRNFERIKSGGLSQPIAFSRVN